MKGFDKMRGGRKVWLCIKDLNRSDIEGEQARELLYALYLRAVSTSWLRVILDGMKGALPSDVEKATQPYSVGPIAQGDIAEYVRRFHDFAGEPLGAQSMQRLVSLHWKVYTDALRDDRKEAARKLSEAMVTYLAYA